MNKVTVNAAVLDGLLAASNDCVTSIGMEAATPGIQARTALV